MLEKRLQPNHEYFYLLVPNDSRSLVARGDLGREVNSTIPKGESYSKSFACHRFQSVLMQRAGLGAQRSSVDILTVGHGRWFDAIGPKDVKAFIAFPNSETLPEEARKKRKIDA